jgi:hypothetical protein
MNGQYRFNGHRGDILNADYLSKLITNPCYVACNNGERKANSRAVPDINNVTAQQYWASTIFSRYTSYKNIILGAPVLYKNFYRNFNYSNEHIGIEVPDGSAWGNSTDNSGCSTGNFNGNPYPKESDQQFLLANFTASKINIELPVKRFQCYAYSNHADVPSASISINKNIDVQVVATAFNSESTPVGLLNRWYERHPYVSEYDYMNIPQWTGETPIFSLNNYKKTLLRLKEKNSQGIVMEASPAKFVSLPFLFAGNRFLQYDISVDSSLNEFSNTMFPADVAVQVKQFLQYCGDDNVMNGGSFIIDNKFKIPLLLTELNNAVIAAKSKSSEVIARLQELKAYMHYMILYYGEKSYKTKEEKAASICLYLAKINKLQLVNCYFLILDIVNKYSVTTDFYKRYNINNGTAYLNGNLPAITDEEINRNFEEDKSKYASSVTDYKFLNAIDIVNKMDASALKPLDTIKLSIGYTNGYEYPNKSEFYFYAPTAGKININNITTFDMPGKGFLNIIVEAVDKSLLVIKDETLTRENKISDVNITVPFAGLYKVSFVSKYKTSTQLTITTNGNTFYRNVPFYGNKVENYRNDNFKSLAQYFYVPDISKVYFSINNACYTGNCLSSAAVQSAFGIKNNKGENPEIKVSTFDSSLYEMPVADSNKSSFWRVTQMREYNFCFANISNIEVFAEPKKCTGTDFTAAVINKDGNCFTRITASQDLGIGAEWQIYDGSKKLNYKNVKSVDIPEILSSEAIIKLKTGIECITIKRSGDIKDYVKSMQSCASGAALPGVLNKLIVFPNPSSNVFNFKKNNTAIILNRINVYDLQGKKVADINNTGSINLSFLPAGIYFFSAQKDNDIVNGKLIKK